MTGTGKKAALHNLGCKVNAYETEAMQQLLEKAGYEIVPFEAYADVYIINTCSVTNIADRKSRQMMRRPRRINPSAIVVAAGCYVQTSSEQTKKEIDADILLGNNKKHDLIPLLEEAFQKKQEGMQPPLKHLACLDMQTAYETLRVTRTAAHTRAFIKVQDGCNQFCSYCIIPYARGRVRSRDLDDVREEIRELARTGTKEVVLTGIHLSSYGVDLDGITLADLIEAVDREEGIERIRLGSLEPGIITPEFLERIGQARKLCPHFHLSLQSGCDTVLRRMNRRYTSAQYREKCSLLRSYFEDPAITSDVIVGFPGETQEEFEITRAYLQDIDLYETHVFRYSRRKGTRADRMEGQLGESVKAERSSLLMQDDAARRERYQRRNDGREKEVLFERRILTGGKAFYEGYTREYIRAVTEDTGTDLTNTILKGRLKVAFPDCYLEDAVLK